MEIIHVSHNPINVYKSKVLKLKKNVLSDNNNNNSGVKTIKKCLFGAPDLAVVEGLLQEQIREDRERFKQNFGINIEDVENMENENKLYISTPPRKRKLERCNRPAKRRKLFSNVDSKITDYFQVRKNVQHDKKEETVQETETAAIGV